MDQTRYRAALSRRAARLRALPLALLFVAFLSGCGETSAVPATHAKHAKDGAEIPQFSGPWAEDFRSSYRRATSDFERKALADEMISDSEFAEMENRFTTCLEEHSISFSGFSPTGAFEFHFREGMNAATASATADSCAASSGNDTIGSLYFAMRRNPENLDESAIMAACLVGKRVVPRGYGARDYEKDAPEMTFPFSDPTAGQTALDDCGADPLGFGSQK